METVTANDIRTDCIISEYVLCTLIRESNALQVDIRDHVLKVMQRIYLMAPQYRCTWLAQLSAHVHCSM